MVRCRLGGERARTYSAIPATDMATERPASDQASQDATRVLIPSWLFDPAGTTPLYSAIVSQALRQSLRSSFSERRFTDPTKIHMPVGQAMYACFSEIDGGFFEGVWAPGNATANPHYPPPIDTRINLPISSTAASTNGAENVLSAPFARLGFDVTP